jgi:hypothetical protein
MKSWRQFVVMLAVLLPLLAPSMACALPGAHLNAAQSACCKHMSSECGSKAMPDPHGCCHKEVLSGSDWNAVLQSNHTNVHVNLVLTAGVYSVLLLPFPPEGTGYSQMLLNSMPQSPPFRTRILRI